MEKSNNLKKVVIFIPEFPVLTETFIQRDIAKLVEFGNLDIDVLYLKKGKGELDGSLKDKAHEIRLTPFKLLSSLSYMFTKKDELAKIRHILKGDLTRNRLQKYYLMFKSLGYARILNQYHPGEIHLHFYSDFSSIGMFSAIILGIPFSINAHARDVFEYPHLPKSKGNLSKFITVCNRLAYKRCMEISGVGEEKVHLIYHGIDPENIFPKHLKKEKTEIPTIFMGGTRITEKKGISYMIEASAILKQRGISHRVDLVGVGEGYQEIVDEISKNDLNDTFFVHGAGEGLPFSELSNYYFSSDIFVLPIIKTKAGDSDGIPNVIIEACLAKLPIITIVKAIAVVAMTTG